ncbi:Rieske (2Fe-2S) protein [Streptomyces sp. 6N223]|uniref:Rieske (2Fe-2S) protein n=1 Tax=Streptomyces sp. 6N223 TaxID=3457412 RepID=UPI003FD3E298
MTATPRSTSRSRRAVLTTAAGAAGAFTLTACGSDDESSGSNDTSGSASDGDSPDSSSDGQGGDEGQGGSGSGGEPLASVDEVPVGEAAGPFATPDGEAMLFRPDESSVVCFSAACTHKGCTVEADGTELSCPCHGSVFDAATGEVLNGPADEPLPAVTVRIEGDQIVTA